MEIIRCLSCNGVLFKRNPLDNKGNWAIDPRYDIELSQDSENSYFKCPHCGAKNIVVDSVSPTGLPQLEIVRVEK